MFFFLKQKQFSYVLLMAIASIDLHVFLHAQTKFCLYKMCGIPCIIKLVIGLWTEQYAKI